MISEVLNVKNDLRKWADDGMVTLLRLPLKDGTNGGRLGVFGLHLEENQLEVTVTGFDRPGVLAYLARGFKLFDLNIDSCFGEKLKRRQGSYFELASPFESLDKLAQLYEYFLRDDGFQPGR